MSNNHTLEFNKEKFLKEVICDSLFWDIISRMSEGRINENSFYDDPSEKHNEYKYDTTDNITEAEPIYYIENNVKSNDFEKCMERINACETECIYIKYDVTFEVDDIKVMFNVYHKYYRTTVDNVNKIEDVFEVYYKSVRIDYDPFYYCKYSNDK